MSSNASMTSPPPRPARQSRSSLRPSTSGSASQGHVGGTANASGAGLWLAGSKHDSGQGQLDAGKAGGMLAPSGPAYHFPAHVAGNRASAELLRGGSQQSDGPPASGSDLGYLSTSDTVDLDLSFDFVSQLEGLSAKPKLAVQEARPTSSSTSAVPSPASSRNAPPPRPSNPTPSRSAMPTIPPPPDFELRRTVSNTSSSTSPRGMSTTKWSSRRKLPPPPLALSGPSSSSSRKKKGPVAAIAAAAAEPASYFSPMTATSTGPKDIFSPTSGFDDEDDLEVEEALAVTPLSATRRGEESGLSKTDSVKNVSGRRRSSSSVSRRSLGPPSLPPNEPLPALPTSAPPLPILQPRTLPLAGNTDDRPALARSKSARARDASVDEEEDAAMYSSSLSDQEDDDDDAQQRPRLRRTARQPLISRSNYNKPPPSSFLHRQSWSTGMSHGGASTNASHGASTGASHGESSVGSRSAHLGHRSKGDSLASAESFRTAITGSTHHQSSSYHSGPSAQSSSIEHSHRSGTLQTGEVPPVPFAASALLFQPLSAAASSVAASTHGPSSSSSVQADPPAAPTLAPAPAPPVASFSSPQMGSYKSTPETPFSPLFSEMGTAITGDTSPGQGNTPLTKFAQLREDTRRHSGDGTEGSNASATLDAGKPATDMRRTSSSPGQRQIGLAKHNLTQEPIAEERSSGMPDRIPSGLPRSETAQWIRSQSKAHSLGASTETDESQYQPTQPMVVSTASSGEGHEAFFSPALSQEVEQPTRRGEGEARLPAIAGRRRASSTGPWPQSPLLLSSNLATEVDSRDVSAELKSMAPETPAPAPSGLGLDFGPDTTFEDEMSRRNLVASAAKGKTVERGQAMVPVSVSDLATGSANSVIIHDSEQSSLVDLDLEFDIVGLSSIQGAEEAEPTVPTPAHTKGLTPTGSISSTIEGFACNVTPPVHDVELPQLPTATARPQSKVQIQEPAQRRPDSSIVVNRLTIQDPLRLDRNSALSIVAVDVEDDSFDADEATPSKLDPRHSKRSTAGLSWKALANMRWGQKLFAQNNGGAVASGAAGNRSGARRAKTKSLDLVEMQKALASPPMRSLTLVSRRDEQVGHARRGSRAEQVGHARRGSRAEQAAATTLRSGPLVGAETIASAPASATFPPETTVTEPTAAVVPQHTTSKRVKRRSRLGYLADGQEIRVDMAGSDGAPQPSSSRSPDPQLRAVLDEMKSPRVGPSPSGWTPQLAFGPGGIPMWGQLPPTSPPLEQQGAQHATSQENAPRYPAHVRTEPESPWLAFDEAEADLQASRDRLRLLASQTMPGATLPHQYFTKLQEEAALRRRSTLLARSAHRPSASVPPTATILPDGSRNKRSSRVLLHGPEHANGTLLHVEDDEQLDGARPSRSAGRPMSIFVPTSAIEAHLLRSAGVATATDAAAGSKGLSSELPSFFTAPAKALESATPSVSLFWAGFLGMPWLWLIGGWGLGEDGRIAVKSKHEGGEGKVAFWEHQESMKQARLHDLRQSGLRNFSPSSMQGIKSPVEDASDWDASGHGAEASNGSSGAGDFSTPYESARNVSASIRKMESQATLGSRISEGGTRHSMPHANRIPSARSRSLASALSINPEVRVAKSPVRTSEGLLLNETQDHAVSIEQLAAESRANPRPRGSSAVFAGLSEEERRSQALLELDDRHRSVVLAAGPSTDHLAPWQPFRRWAKLERYVLYNRVAAIVGGLLVAAGWSLALGVLVSHF